jgi:putative membrane protein
MQHPIVLGLVHLLLTGIAVFIVAKLMPGMRAKSYGAAVFFAFVMAVLNAIAWHFLAPLTVTLSVLTLGLGALVINGVLFLMAGKVTGIEFSGCITASLASLAVTLVNWGIHAVIGNWTPLR